MSYLSLPRLVFSGRFQADVSTVNNDVRHYDNQTFQARYQLPQTQTEANGWYNPNGTGAFHLIDLKVTDAIPSSGAPQEDVALDLFVNAQNVRSSAKIVDLDPQMQIVSTLFGLRVFLTDGTTNFLSGTYVAAPFRDMANGRQGSASATFTSVLKDLEWSEEATQSPTLSALKAAAEANQDRLSINLTLYNYGRNQLGLLIGAIGAYSTGDPETFVSARRLTNNGARGVIGDMMADVANDTLSFDFSNSVGLNRDLSVTDHGQWFGAILRNSDEVRGIGTTSAAITVGSRNGDSVQASEIKLLTSIAYTDSDFLSTQGAIADCPLDVEAQQLIKDHPVAIVGPASGANGDYQIILRESYGGLFARADNFVHRMDPPVTVDGAGENNFAHAVVRFRATQWGQSIKDVVLTTQAQAASNSNAYWGSGGSGPLDPTAPYPEINTPEDVVHFTSRITTRADGWADCPIKVSNPGNVRGYVDGQIFIASYQMAVSNASPQAQLDLIVIHAREAQSFSDPPTWQELEPIMQQYDNLYPIMSRQMFRVADPEVAQKHATLLALAFSRPIDDPNHMPATRDLSASKRQAILRWLSQYTDANTFHPESNTEALSPALEVVREDTTDWPKAQLPSTGSLESMLADLDDDVHGKTPVMRNYLESEIQRLKREG